jgi:hypothetical protein
MAPLDETRKEPARAEPPDIASGNLLGDAMLSRVKQVARVIAERVREVAGDTELDQSALSEDTGEQQPLA